MLRFGKKKQLSVEQMIEMEDALKHCELVTMNLHPDDEKLFEKLHLKVEYVDDMDDDNEAELCPIDDDFYLGLIRLRKELTKYKFAYSHEIIHYIFDVGYGKRVTDSFTRKRKGKTDSIEEQKTNYMAAAYIMPYKQFVSELQKYDDSHPKMDEVKFISDLKKRYGQSETAVIRRIREVRMMSKVKYC